MHVLPGISRGNRLLLILLITVGSPTPALPESVCRHRGRTHDLRPLRDIMSQNLSVIKSDSHDAGENVCKANALF